ncbi:receptor expression-enhancing protein 4, partial [Egretta garzetta]|uniref:receptor expression-enhancing protein 4 n=1 Tax=Egretta garzetta TaxID=188379 RepID=UPI00051F02F9
MVLEGLKAKLRCWGRQLCYSLLLLLYAGWPQCLTPPLRYRLLFGMLYPAYASYKAVKTKNIREYADPAFPFYYEVKMAFVIWLLSPYTRGASLLYRKFVHPTLSPKEKSQGALAGRLRSFSMQDLRSIPDETPVHYRDPLYLEEQESRRQLL